MLDAGCALMMAVPLEWVDGQSGCSFGGHGRLVVAFRVPSCEVDPFVLSSRSPGEKDYLSAASLEVQRTPSTIIGEALQKVLCC